MSRTLSQDIQKELENFVAHQTRQIPELAEDATDVAEYLVLLVNNGKTPEEAYNDLHSIFTSEALVNVVQSAYKALENYQNTQAQALTPTPQPEQPSQQLQAQQQPAAATQTQTDSIITDGDSNGVAPVSIPTRPAAYVARGGIQKGRGGKFATGPRSFALRNPEALQNALNLASAAGSDTYVNAKGQLKKKGRCHQFPHCPNRDCPYAHPTKPCFSFLNGACENAPGTCNYLHPSEDQALIEELEKTKNEFLQKRNEKHVQYAQAATGITLCKFGIMCTNQQCPFGHPTPANEDAKVLTFEWCAANLNCSDASCVRAHSSLSKIKEVSRPSTAKQTAEKSLEPCKFGSSCTNRFCKFRHATSKTMCRDGEQCTRIDCFFSHPINEECRFGEGCKNPNCLFKHPNGKAPAAGKIPAKSLSWTKTNERQFAVPDDQVLEQAPPQEG